MKIDGTVAGHDDLEGISSPAERLQLFGHAEQWTELTSAYREERLHHAWLLQGSEGIGKATTAIAFARFLIGGPGVLSTDNDASGPSFHGEHPVVRQIAQGSHPNFLHLRRPAMEKGEGFRTQITIDEIRKLNQFFRGTAGGGWRVALIDPADDMNRSAANALLKILEEPPERSVFFITNHTPGRLLPTIRSRSRVLRFQPLTNSEVENGLRSSLPDEERARIVEAAEIADGSLRSGFLQLLSGGLEIASQIERIYGSRTPDWRAIHSVADLLGQRGREEAWEMLRDGLMDRLSSDARDRSLNGDAAQGNRLAELWQHSAAHWREAVAFNLDRKQTLLTFLSDLARVRSQFR